MKLLAETVQIALRSLRANKLRTGLTALGVIIGIGTIIGMLSLINGINRSVDDEFKRLGPNVIYLTKDEPGIHIGHGRDRDRKPLRLSEIEALQRQCEAIDKVSLISDRRAKVVYRGRRTGMITVRGALTDYGDIARVEIDQGRFFGEIEARRSRVCILGDGVIRGLFGPVSAIGKEVEIEGRRFKVLATLEQQGMVFGGSSDDTVIIPYHWHRLLFGEGEDGYAMVLPVASYSLNEAIEDLRQSFRIVRKLRLGESDTFSVSTQESLLETYKKLTASIYWVMRIVASIALVVSGIGIMNIMLVAVMERTREVGIRKAVGASRKAIMSQFLIEAVILTLMGGVLGIALGYLIRLGVSLGTPLPASVPVWGVPVSLGICCTIGVFFGLYPAVRASSLDPVRALRYE
jgi:putative ABC transport system permease protein